MFDKNCNCFDAIRYILALLITTAHYSVLSGTHLLNNFDVISNRVSIFFIISGFFSFMMYQRIPEPKHFAIKRTKRLIPAYWLTIILSVALLSFSSNMGLSEFWVNDQTYSYLISNLAFANFLHPSLPGVFESNPMTAVNGALWTMKVELMLLITVPIAYKTMEKIGRAKTLILIFLISTIYRISVNWLYNSTGDEIYNIMYRQMGGQLIYFYSGAATYIYREYIMSRTRIIIPFAIMIYILHSRYAFLELAAPACMALIVITFAIKFKYLYWVGRLPNISYSMYLVHFPIIQTFIHFGLHKDYPIGTLILSLLSTIVIAYLMWYMAERPFIKKRAQ